MKRNIVLLVLIFLTLPAIVYAVTTFVIQETDRLSLQTNATDPDRDNLITYYNSPLNKNGEWQTNYGDAGNYRSSITVSDSFANTSEEILIVVRRKEEPPKIEIYSPIENTISIKEGQAIRFYAEASDLNKDELVYTWYFNSSKSAKSQSVWYTASYYDAGTHNVKIEVSDGIFTVSREWIVQVEDFDIQKILDGIEDVTVNETQIARLKLPNFTQYGLEYAISDPIGNDNEWQTTYDDAGSYNAEVQAEGNGFRGSADVEVTVRDLDRLLVFEKLDNQIAEENKTLRITLKATDPDNDIITYSADNLPEGAKLEDNVFTWTPGFDTIKKEDFIDYFVEKFTVLSKNFYVQSSASSKDRKVVQNVVITVKDGNRAPIIEDMDPITVNEGDTIHIKPVAYDPDNDKVRLAYSGYLRSDTYKTTYDNAGEYTVTVTASDGSLQASKDVKIIINGVNMPPIFSRIADRKAKENDNIVILLDAKDPDNDQITYSIINAPDNASIRENIFTWTPSYSVAGKNEVKKLDLIFTVNDGKSDAKQIGRFEISDKNRAPVIWNASTSLSADPDKPVFMFVKAYDPDGDKLSYIWDFGLLDRYEGTDKHQRTFTSTGPKEVKVKVSDGTDEAEQIINIFVRDYASENKARVRYVNKTVSSVSNLDITVRKETRVYDSVSGFQPSASSNRPPKITDATSSVIAKANQPVLLYVRAADDDNDPLTYTWDFGFFDKYTGSQYHQRTFTGTGVKTIKVTVSDGRYNVVQLITVNVVE